MLTRRHIRIKVMQSIYALKGHENYSFDNEKKFLLNSIQNTYNLYLLMLSLLVHIQKKAEDYLIKSQQKHLATQADKNPNKKFINNTVLQLLVTSKALEKALNTHKIHFWSEDNEYIDIIFKSILASDVYRNYMQTQNNFFKEDKAFLTDIYKHIIAPNEKLYNYIEDKSITWLDDLPIINTALVKALKKVSPDKSDDYFLSKYHNNVEDEKFALTLFKNCIENTEALNEEIQKKTSNWDTERIAKVDYVLLQMAICEIQTFESIPVKVTINEYLEIAKEYSTPKSSIFINGILDNLIKDYKTEGKLNKTGRGLM